MAQPRKIKRALISVYDKTGLTEFARALVEEFGIELISTGGTARHLKEAGLPVTLVEEITGFPEMLDGRVKTLHPKIHAGILADRDNPEHMRQLEAHGIKPIDMVVVNLYPFEKTVAEPNCTFEQAIEMIDIGGPCMLRAAAKNNSGVLVVIGNRSYTRILQAMRESSAGCVPDSIRLHQSRIGFHIVSRYDAHVTAYLAEQLRQISNEAVESFEFPVLAAAEPLRYGENPHQRAQLRPHMTDDLTGQSRLDRALLSPTGATELSFNNLVDVDAALGLCDELGVVNNHAAVFIKHTNACGVGFGTSELDSYRRAYLGDVNAAMGGILATSFGVKKKIAEEVMDSFDRWGRSAEAGGFFVEVWTAPFFEKDAIEIIRTRKAWGSRVRLMKSDDLRSPHGKNRPDFKAIASGFLIQDYDSRSLDENEWKVVTKRKPSESEISDVRLAWLVAKHTKSNAISICKDGMLIGNGAGQMSRVMSCRIATWLAKENRHEDKLKGSVAASDAFFPFPDGPSILMDAGVTAIIQPGGSKNDDKVIAACDERNLAMIFTGTRHFKH
jgi:phosphoribosylaminoimidazolecarboxamide formyltransferase/IMP cyclohydrolase